MSEEIIQSIPDPEGRFSGLVHGGIETITTAGGNVMLDAAVSYRTAAGEISTVKEGFVFDWASIPLAFTWYIPPAGDGKNCYGIAALFHDWLYCHRKIGGRPVSRAECDGLFLEIMLYVGVTAWLARTMWAAVRAGGWFVWWKRADKDIIPQEHRRHSGVVCLVEVARPARGCAGIRAELIDCANLFPVWDQLTTFSVSTVRKNVCILFAFLALFFPFLHMTAKQTYSPKYRLIARK